MPRVLIFGVPLRHAGGRPAWTSDSRGGMIAGALRARGVTVFAVGTAPDGTEPAPNGIGPGLDRPAAAGEAAEPRFFPLPAGGERRSDIYHHLIGDTEADAVVAVGLTAALTLAEVPEGPPRWIDLSADLPSWRQAGGGAAATRRDHYRALGLLLARGDRFSCAETGQAHRLRVLLGLHGRLADGEDAPVVSMTGAEALAPLLAWIERPARGPRPPADDAGETELRRRIGDLEHELAVIHGTRLFRLRARLLALRRRFAAWRARRPLRRAGRWLLDRLIAVYRALAGAVRRVLRPIGRTLATAALIPPAVDLLLGARRRSARSRPAPAADPSAAPVSPGRRPRLMIVSPYPIHPPDHGGGVRLFNLIVHLAEHCELVLMVLIRARDDPAQRAALAPYCRHLELYRWQPRFDAPATTWRPPGSELFRDPRLASRICDLASIHDVDVVQLEYAELAQYAEAVAELPGVRTILVEHDLAFRALRRRRRLGFRRRYPSSRHFGSTFGDWLRQLRHEVLACRRVDQVHVMSPDDGAYLAPFLDDGWQRLRVVPNAVDCRAYAPPADPPPRRGVLLVGNYQNLPNVDAFDFFDTEIWPRVRARRPDATITVVGARMPERILAAGGRDGIEVVGEVPDLAPYYHRHRLMLVPIRAGSGTRLKLFEAFAAGLPAVSTTVGAEGIDYRDGEHLLIADRAEEIAAAVERLLDDDALCARLAGAARALVEARYDWSHSARANFAGVLELAADRLAQPAEPAAGRAAGDAAASPDVSIVIPTLNGGDRLARALEAIAGQTFGGSYEVLCVDSGSRAEERAVMRAHGARVLEIDRATFDHGRTRDLGAAHARGRVLVFLNQDAVPASERWLAELTAPLLGAGPAPAAVQGGIAEFPAETEGVDRFFWDSCGERFYFTRESTRWLRRYGGLGFSTVNAAIRRDVWHAHPFGWAPIMEDKKWQRQIAEAGLEIVVRPEAAVLHTHDYDLRSLSRRCRSEGFGWRLLGERYAVGDLLRDLLAPRVWREWLRGLVRGEMRAPAAVLFPWLRPWMLFVGNRWSRGVEH